jgi:hypothetical protein
LEYTDGSDHSTFSPGAMISSVGNYFDENGVLCYDRYTTDLKKIYDETRLNVRKDK